MAKRANWPFGIRPPDHVIAWPARVCVHLGLSSPSSSSNSRGTPIVTRTTPCGSSAFGTENATSTASPTSTDFGVSDRCAPAGAASASAARLKPEMTSDDHPLNLIRAFSDLEDLLVTIEARDGVLVHEPVP